jgi:hypothetical protein
MHVTCSVTNYFNTNPRHPEHGQRLGKKLLQGHRHIDSPHPMSPNCLSTGV